MSSSIVSTTNIFCLIGKPGSGRNTLLKNVLNKSSFIEKYNIKRFVYGTTRPMTPYDIDGVTYHFFTKEEFKNLDPEEIIESRSYDPIFKEPYYYFTLVNHIRFGSNYIGKISSFQYNELKKWAVKVELKMPNIRINLFPIIINAPIFEREKRIMNESSTSEDVYKMCSRFISERYEFSTVAKNNPELIDALNPKTLILDNSFSDKKRISILGNDIEKFISRQLIMQGK